LFPIPIYASQAAKGPRGMKGANDEKSKKKKRNGLKKWGFGRGGKGTEEKYKRPEAMRFFRPSCLLL
jgi:hypothetical protein